VPGIRGPVRAQRQPGRQQGLARGRHPGRSRRARANKRGFLVFATAGPNTRTTQLFINFGDNARLDGMGFAPFGKVVDGMDVVDKIYSGYGESPRQDLLTDQGDSYVTANFPKIDKIKLARIIPPAPARPPLTPQQPPKPTPKPAAAQH
jgi:cyclophilin family peptidyl-prolyl cis-trans isomerase